MLTKYILNNNRKCIPIFASIYLPEKLPLFKRVFLLSSKCNQIFPGLILDLLNQIMQLSPEFQHLLIQIKVIL